MRSSPAVQTSSSRVNMTEEILANPRLRRLGMALLLVVTSMIAGYGVYEGKMKILAILALFTGGFLLRQASVRNAYWLAVTALQLSHVRMPMIRDEFELDRWLGLAFLAALSVMLFAFNLDKPAWPGLTHLLAGGLLVVLASSSSWSPEPEYSIARAGSVGLVLFTAFVGLWSHARSVERVRSIADVHLDMLWIVFPLGVLVWLVSLPGSMAGGRLQSIFENPNTLGMWASVGLPLAFGMALTHPVRRRRQAAWLMLATGGLCVLLSGSRGGVLGAALGIGIYAGLRFSRLVIAWTALAATGLSFLLLYGVEIVGRSETLMTLVRPESLADMSSRKVWWSLGSIIAQQKPYFGHGFGMGESLFAVYGVDMAYGGFDSTVHNTYLAAWMEVGYVGAGLLIACTAWACWLGYRTWRRDPNGEGGLLALALLGSTVALAAHSVVEEKLLSAGNPWMMPFWVSLALMARLHQLQSQERAEAAEVARRRAIPRAPWARALKPQQVP